MLRLFKIPVAIKDDENLCREYAETQPPIACFYNSDDLRRYIDNADKKNGPHPDYVWAQDGHRRKEVPPLSD